MAEANSTDQGAMPAADVARTDATDTSAIAQLAEGVKTGAIVAIAATVKYADGRIRYVPIGAAPDPLAGLAEWISA